MTVFSPNNRDLTVTKALWHLFIVTSVAITIAVIMVAAIVASLGAMHVLHPSSGHRYYVALAVLVGSGIALLTTFIVTIRTYIAISLRVKT